MKKILIIKILGSIAMITSLLGIFIAISGNLNLFNQQRTPVEPLVKQPRTTNSDNKPKYSFYDELKQRKTELERSTDNNNANRNVSSQTPAVDNRLYVVQVGAFSKEVDAQKTAKKLKQLGLSNRIVKPRNMYLVQAGPFKGRTLAQKHEKKLRNESLPTLIKVYNQ